MNVLCVFAISSFVVTYLCCLCLLLSCAFVFFVFCCHVPLLFSYFVVGYLCCLHILLFSLYLTSFVCSSALPLDCTFLHNLGKWHSLSHKWRNNRVQVVSSRLTGRYTTNYFPCGVSQKKLIPLFRD